MANVDYVVAIDWDITDDKPFPKRIVLMDTLKMQFITTLTVGNNFSQSEEDWHIPEECLNSFLQSSYFKKLCLPMPEEQEPVLGTNDPIAWNFFIDRQMPIHWLKDVHYCPYMPITIRAVQQANFVKEEKFIGWACEYLEKETRKEQESESLERENAKEEYSNARWKRDGKRLCRMLMEGKLTETRD